MSRMILMSLLICTQLLTLSSGAWAYYPQRNSGSKDIQNLKNRLNRATDKKGQNVKALAHKVVCKKDKKPVCYVAKVVYESNYALAHVTRPEGNKNYFVLLQNNNGNWRARYAKSFKRLKLSYWRTDRAPVPEPVAQKLIAKLRR